jgi:hypothetical protein
MPTINDPFSAKCKRAAIVTGGLVRTVTVNTEDPAFPMEPTR